MDNAWGILRCIIDTCMKLPDGKYLILKDPLKVSSLLSGAAPTLNNKRERTKAVTKPVSLNIPPRLVLTTSFFL